VVSALRRAAQAGPFFTLPLTATSVPSLAGGEPPAVTDHRPDPTRLPASTGPGPGWHRHADLTAPTGRPVLATTLADYARRLPTAEPRVAASLLYQGYAALIWSPLLACLRDGVLLDLDPDHLWLRCHPGQSLTVQLDSPTGFTSTAPHLVLDLVAGPLLGAMATALRRIAPVSDRLLAGNAASALVGAAQVLVRHDPSWVPEVGPLLAALLRTAPLAGTLTRTPAGLRRRSCCLYYRVPGGGLCGDCALTHVPTRGG
jgi:ferric iron reductase protein FhuF